MTTLHDRLVDLAEAVPVALPAPGLWDRGLRYRRRRQVGTAVVLAVAVAAFAALGSITWLRSPQAFEPAPASSEPALPNRLFVPSPWLPGTRDAGPLGTLAAVVSSGRGSWSGISEQLAPVGVSGVTGEYRFLDLPGLVPEPGFGSWALAPDGEHVAYLYREDGADLSGGLASGLAVYDTSTGDLRRHRLPGDRGILANKLLWAGDDTVVLSYGTVLSTDEGIGTEIGTPLAWHLDESEPHSLTGFPRNRSLVGAGPGFVVGTNDADRFVIADTTTGAVRREFRMDGKNGWFPPAVADTQAQVAAMPGNRTPNLVLAGATAPSPVQLHKVTQARLTFAVLAWADDQHVAVRQQQAEAGERFDVALSDLALVDVATGDSTVVLHDAPSDVQVAADLLGQPTVEAVEPPHPLDPRRVACLGVGLVLVAGWVLILWRRRVRP